MAEDFRRDLARDIVDEICSNDWTEAQKGRVMRQIIPVINAHVALLTADIAEFHTKFGLEYRGHPRQLPPDMFMFRYKFMQEELNEYADAHEAGDIAKQFDALIDLAYVLFGTSYLQGFPFAKGWQRVQVANMAKVRVERAEDSLRNSTFDVVKPPGWTAPDLNDLVGILPPPPPDEKGQFNLL